MKTLHAIQAYRGFAAVLVVLHHTNFIMSKYSLETPLSQIFHFGHAGVEFFFVLSGFILYHTYCNGNKSRDIKSFLKNRFIRIYPLYWTVTLVLLPVWLLRPSFGEPYHRNLSGIITSLLLMPQEHPPHVIVAWSLTHEILFYLFFSLIIMNKKTGLTVSGLIFTLTVFFNIFSNTPDFPSVFLLSKYNTLFLLGILTGLLTEKIKSGIRTNQADILRYSAFFAGNALFIILGLLDNTSSLEGKYTWFFGIASAMIIIGSCSNGINSFLKKRQIALFVGSASYSIYLIHIFIIEFFCKRIKSTNMSELIPNDMTLLLLALSGVLGGSFLYVMFEKRVLAWMKTKSISTRNINNENLSYAGLKPIKYDETF
ncbi:acyltransferase family protein [Desulforegula conservatrix]|uniref:acyltransferase family protein n=1 Tax=Desulforegula conservatrix TaxID=153026 RepID=UPI00040505DC|nr:acyltransferase [Desulforegula conservatrix]